ncbi:hypothetical protein GCM10009122_20230 [Fulvivirga kasyanovii]|uniref:Glycosyl transferase family 28 C-terminal domain-containing protein n=1 Tax=Fulvivirga kasyanovii TaxID=396812 RepID=A0ABW9RP54_9BACT|nr:PssE/Cps14G family polysaccharide biosynthesis glycosyltransferase [Fulvivirga kasyanovii]MTI25929.1 hypothetical protein [Fulvivirga kasyanovii]
MSEDYNKKIFVTVGTTNYDNLIQFCDNKLNKKKYSFIFQIGNGKYIPKNHQYFTYTSNIDDYYSKADIIITHAGAGTVYKLLEESKDVIVVPNLNLIDDHQKELASFVDQNSYAPVIYCLNELPSAIDSFETTSLKKYENDSSALIESIVEILQK